jgi:hypothetical protein
MAGKARLNFASAGTAARRPVIRLLFYSLSARHNFV